MKRARFGYRRLFVLLRRAGEPSGINRIYRLYREEGLMVRKRRARRRAVGTRAPILVEARPNARWSLDFVHDQFACGRRFRILNVVDDVIAARAKAPLGKPRQGRSALPNGEIVMAIQAIVPEMPSYGYRRVWALLRRAAQADGRPAPNHKRVHRVMNAHGLLLERHAGGVEARRHDGRMAVDQSNLRWCSDGFELGCDNGEKVRVAFALDCCDREASSFAATTEGIKGEDVRDLITVAVETGFRPVNRLPDVIEWLTDNGSPTSPTKLGALLARSASNR